MTDYQYRLPHRDSQNDFDKFALTYSLERPFDFYLILSRYKFAARLLQGKQRIIDVGCGEGWGTALLKDLCRESSVTAIDTDEHCIQFIKRYNRNHVEALHSDFFDSSLTADGIVCLDVIEHIQRDKVRSFLRKLKKAMNPGGQVIIGTPSKRSLSYASTNRKKIHEFEFFPDEFKKELSGVFERVNLFSMTDECVNTSFIDLAWYLMAVCS